MTSIGAIATRFEHDADPLTTKLTLSADKLDSIAPLDSSDAPGGQPIGSTADIYRNLCNELNKTYNVLIAGVQNSGKSTLVNVLLGRWVMPVNQRSVDALLSLITYDSQESATIHYRDGTTRNCELAEAVKLIDQRSEHLKKEQNRTDYCHFRLDVPALRTFCLVNSPGLNDVTEVSNRTKEFFKNADAIVWVFDSPRIEQCRIMGAVLDVCRQYGRKIIAVLNRIDDLEKMGDATHRAQVIERFKDIFDGCYEAYFTLVARDAAVGLGIREPLSSHQGIDKQRLLEDSGYPLLFQHFDTHFFGHEKHAEKVASVENKAQAMSRETCNRIDPLVSVRKMQVSQLRSRNDGVNALLRKVESRRRNINAQLRLVAQRYTNKMIDVYLAVADRVMEDHIGFLSIFKGGKALGEEVNKALDEKANHLYPEELFYSNLTRDVEAEIGEGWAQLSEQCGSDPELKDKDFSRIKPTLDPNVKTGGAVNHIVAGLVKVALRTLFKVASERLARDGMKRVIQITVRAIISKIAKIVGKQITVALLKSLAKKINPIMWIMVIADAKKAMQEISGQLEKARADVKSALDAQRDVLADHMYDALCKQNEQISESIRTELLSNADESEVQSNQLQAEVTKLEEVREEMLRLWQNPDGIPS